ncbi:nitrous oxide reductase accessory protein NosL [Halorientalis salina]|uniref:nitrous oxide reductase accessory protein NosL n=1 Tax=Halorientalis salina TaxID=2932266 RepID=UPI0010ABE3C0|nr:nitrous oxide reductase accessory protein NosL [Halorientalis salina]
MDETECGCPGCPAHGGSDYHLTRRRLVAGAAAGVGAVAGCTELSSESTPSEPLPDPVTMTTDDACEACGMIIPNHPGPTTEVFYPEHTPSGHANPARFCSTWEAFHYDFQRQDRGWDRSVMYVTDYSAVDYRLMSERGETLISTHVDAEAFVDAREVVFLAGSAIKGAMGRDLLAFSDRADADDLESEYGGELVELDEVTPQLISQLSNQ